MITLRKAQNRGLTQTHWLESLHTFSFGNYYDPKFTGFKNLLVINEDKVQPHNGFGTHGHRNMEIISYVIEGELEHRDNMGTGSIIRPGEIQLMSAGSGVTHSEFNPNDHKLLHFLQIWITPSEVNLQPRYEQKTITKIPDKLLLIGSQDGREDSITIHQDVDLYVAYLSPNAPLIHTLQTNRSAWVQVVNGEVNINDKVLSAGDGAAIQNENLMTLYSAEPSEFLLFDLG